MADAKVDTLTSQKQEIQDEKNRIKSELDECNRSLQTKMDDIDNLRDQVNRWVDWNTVLIRIISHGRSKGDSLKLVNQKRLTNNHTFSLLGVKNY